MMNDEEWIERERKIAWNEAIEAAVKAIASEGNYNPSSYYIEAIRKLKR